MFPVSSLTGWQLIHLSILNKYCNTIHTLHLVPTVYTTATLKLTRTRFSMKTENQNQYLTKVKFEELKKELDQLRSTGRREVAEELEYSKQLGDLSENAEYHQARERQALLEDRINKLDTLLKSALIVNSHDVDAVNVGSIVELKKEGKETMKYTIVGSEEADMTQNKLSIASPLGQALKGKKKGETFSLKTPKGPVSYKIVGIA